jgi:hypothetical protein
VTVGWARPQGGLVNAGSMRDESEARAGARVGGERAGRWGMHGRGVGGARTVDGARGRLDRFVGWLV